MLGGGGACLAHTPRAPPTPTHTAHAQTAPPPHAPVQVLHVVQHHLDRLLLEAKLLVNLKRLLEQLVAAIERACVRMDVWVWASVCVCVCVWCSSEGWMGGRPGAGTRQARRGRARSPDRNLPHCRAVKVVQAVDVVLHTRLVGLDRCNTWRRAGGGGGSTSGGGSKAEGGGVRRNLPATFLKPQTHIHTHTPRLCAHPPNHPPTHP